MDVDNNTRGGHLLLEFRRDDGPVSELVDKPDAEGQITLHPFVERRFAGNGGFTMKIEYRLLGWEATLGSADD